MIRKNIVLFIITFSPLFLAASDGTSGLDPKAESLVRDSLAELMKSHHISQTRDDARARHAKNNAIKMRPALRAQLRKQQEEFEAKQRSRKARQKAKKSKKTRPRFPRLHTQKMPHFISGAKVAFGGVTPRGNQPPRTLNCRTIEDIHAATIEGTRSPMERSWRRAQRRQKKLADRTLLAKALRQRPTEDDGSFTVYQDSDQNQKKFEIRLARDSYGKLRKKLTVRDLNQEQEK